MMTTQWQSPNERPIPLSEISPAIIAELRKKCDILIANGVPVLDAQVPGWEDRIHLDSLKLSSCSLCVVGQLLGDYVDAILDEKIELNGREDLGFCVDDTVMEWFSETMHVSKYARIMDAYYTVLTEQWRTYIQQRCSSQ